MGMCKPRWTRGFHATGIESRGALVASAAKYVFHFDILALVDVCVACQVATMKEHLKFAPLIGLGQTDDTILLRVIQELNYALTRKNLPGFFWQVFLRRRLGRGGSSFSDWNCFDAKGFGRRGDGYIPGQWRGHNLLSSNSSSRHTFCLSFLLVICDVLLH